MNRALNTHVDLSATRRQFLGTFAGLGLGGTLLPGVLWAKMEAADTQKLTVSMLQGAAAIAGLQFTSEEYDSMLQAVTQNLTRYTELRKLPIPNDVAPPFYFSPIVPGMQVNRQRLPFKLMALAKAYQDSTDFNLQHPAEFI